VPVFPEGRRHERDTYPDQCDDGDGEHYGQTRNLLGYPEQMRSLIDVGLCGLDGPACPLMRSQRTVNAQ
jgi:hypothetical protein